MAVRPGDAACTSRDRGLDLVVASSARPPPASPTSPSRWRSGWAARSSAPTPRSSTAAWTSAPPRCRRGERAGHPAPPARRARRDPGGQRRRVPAARAGRHRGRAGPRCACPWSRAGPGSTCGRRSTGSRSRRPTPRCGPALAGSGWTDEGVGALLAELRAADPPAADAIEPNNGRRVVRALEVIALTGRPFSATMPTREFVRPTVLVGLRTDREALDARIDAPGRTGCSTPGWSTRPAAWSTSACARGAPRAGRSATPRRSPSSTARSRSRMPSPTPRCAPGGWCAARSRGSAPTRGSTWFDPFGTAETCATPASSGRWSPCARPRDNGAHG